MLNTQLDSSCRRLFPSRFVSWQSQGFSVRAASAVALAGCDTAEQVARLGRGYFEQQPNCGAKTLAELAELAGWPPKRVTVVDTLAAALSLSITDPEEAREAAKDAVIALRRSGFVVSASSAPGGSR